MKEPQAGLIERLHWLIRLRWAAVLGVFVTVFLASRVFGVLLQAWRLYAIAAFIALYNSAFLSFAYRLERAKPPSQKTLGNRLANAQIGVDLVSLSALIHFSGGAENPFILYFIFHMIIASILLSRRAALMQATFAAALFGSAVILEHRGILAHHHLEGFVEHGAYDNPMYIAGILFAFASTIYIAVYMATSIAKKLRLREKSLREANALLEEKDRAKSEYVLRVTHDIKEHLSAIQGCIDPVTAGITGPINNRQKNLLERAASRTGRLIFFVKALLDITRIKLNRRIKMEYFSFCDMLSDVTDFIAVKAREKHILLNTSVGPGIDKIKGAREYLQEAVTNILANAVKYTPGLGQINVEAKDKGNSILIKISDNGIGISEEDMPHIFEEFYRSQNAREAEKDGTGLGLAIAKQVIERHGGKISAESQPGKGTTFSVILPKEPDVK